MILQLKHSKSWEFSVPGPGSFPPPHFLTLRCAVPYPWARFTLPLFGDDSRGCFLLDVLVVGSKLLISL